MLNPPGQPAQTADLRTDLGRSLDDVLDAGILPFIRKRGVRREDGADVVLIEVDPEIPQVPAADIRRPEPLAIRIRDGEGRMPEVLALREDFPSDLVHLNISDPDCPWASLCLYEETWDDMQLTLTAASLLGRAHDWLSRTARGEIHEADQPLEPFVSPAAFPLVLPPSLTADGPAVPLKIERRGEGTSTVLVAELTARVEKDYHVALAFETAPAKQSALRRHPADLHALHELVAPLGLDLVDALRAALREMDDVREHPGSTAARSRPILIFSVPLVRRDGEVSQRPQVFSYWVDATLVELGQALGIWGDIIEGNLGTLIPPDESLRGQGLPLVPLRPILKLTAESARSFSGIDGGDLTITAVGAGALGSQIVMNLARSGFGRWALIDHDSFLPHNLVRHALPGPAIGMSKAEALAIYANSITYGGPQASAMVGNALHRNPEIELALQRADVVLDLAASAAVARTLAQDRDGIPRCISLFLNPRGTDLVALVEDRDRRIRLDALEMQYYRALIRDSRLNGHLSDPTGRVRYGASCRDVSMLIPQDQVGVAAGIGARAVRKYSANSEAALCIWRMDSDLAVRAVYTEVHAVTEWECGQWTVVADEWLLQHLAELRRSRLPAETGGILIGVPDVSRRRLYIVNALPAPPDSTERPAFFDRGCVGLRDSVNQSEKTTGGAVTYVGEWHSHPGRSTAPSDSDANVLDFLVTSMAVSGLPALMLIVGTESVAVFVDTLTPGRRGRRC